MRNVTFDDMEHEYELTKISFKISPLIDFVGLSMRENTNM